MATLPALDVLSTVGSTWLPLVAQASVGTELVSPQAVTVLGASVRQWLKFGAEFAAHRCDPSAGRAQLPVRALKMSTMYCNHHFFSFINFNNF